MSLPLIKLRSKIKHAQTREALSQARVYMFALIDCEVISQESVQEWIETIEARSNELFGNPYIQVGDPNTKEIPFEIFDDHSQESLKGRVLIGLGGIEIFADGYGTTCMQPGNGSPIFVEFHEEELRCLVWDNINQEDASHRISLENAKETKRNG